MADSVAGILRIIALILMTVRTGIPYTLVSAGIYWKILRVMIPGGLAPGNRIMAVFTIGWKSYRYMIGIVRIIVILLMT